MSYWVIPSVLSAALFVYCWVKKERELKRQKAYLQRLFETTPDGLVMLDKDGRVTDVNPAFERIFLYRKEEIIGKPLDDLIFEPGNVENGRGINRRVLDKEQVMIEGARIRGDGKTIKVCLFGCSVVVDGETVGLYGLYRDVTQQRETEAKARHLAFRDDLTDLPNRVAFIREGKARVERGRPFAVLNVDLNRFKNVNDSVGFAVGDRLLAEVGKRLKKYSGEGDMVARMGGDEFGILVDLSDGERLAGASLADAVLKAMNAPFDVGERGSLFLAAAVGIAIYPDHGWDWEELMGSADIAMNEAKSKGLSMVCFDDRMGRAFHQRISLERRMAEAIPCATGFSLAYQPKVDMSTGRIVGLEALCRWNDDGFPIAPDQFIPVAEDTGMILELGRWVLFQACRQGAEWLGKGYAVSLAVNVSARQLLKNEMIPSVSHVLEASGFPAEMLELEITETALIQDVCQSEAVLCGLKALGVSLAIDDFGTGYSSLGYLARFQVDALKIDRVFMPGVDESPCQVNEAIIKSVIALARVRGLTVVAEGVENDHQRKTLLSLGCSVGQGFLFGRPVPSDIMERSLREGSVFPASPANGLSDQKRCSL